MGDIQSSFIEALPKLMIGAQLLSVLLGAVVYLLGRKLPRNGDWLAGLGVLLLLIVSCWGLFSFWPSDVHQNIGGSFVRGWVGRGSDPSSITVGLLPDLAALSMTVLFAVIAAVVLSNRALLAAEPRAHRHYGAFLIGIAGASLAWSSATVWLALGGVFIATFAGFLVHGARWHEEGESFLAIRFLQERSWTLLLALFGAAAIANQGGTLQFGASFEWPVTSLTDIGAILLATGLFLQFQGVPLQGTLNFPSASCPPSRIALSQVIPGLSALAVLIRLEPQFRSVEIFPVLGWVALGSAFLAVLAGLLHHDWRSSLGFSLVSAFCVSASALAFSAPSSALTIAIGASFGAIALAITGTALAAGGGTSKANRKKALWAKSLAITAGLAASGFAGFVGSHGFLHWLTRLSPEPAHLALAGAAVFLVLIQLWKTVFSVFRVKASTDIGWYPILSPLFLMICALAIVWTGSATGGWVPGAQDHILYSLISAIFPGTPEAIELDHAAGVFGGALVVAAVIAYWTTQPANDLWKGVHRSSPGFAEFVLGGFGFERATGAMFRAITRASNVIEYWVDARAWREWIPLGLSRSFGAISRAGTGIDAQLSRNLPRAMRRSVDIPAKFLQLMQSGDVQWYLLFAIGGGIAMLVHFLKT